MNDNNPLYYIIFFFLARYYSQKLHIVNTPRLRRESLDDLIKLILHKVQPPESAPAIERVGMVNTIIDLPIIIKFHNLLSCVHVIHI